MDKTMNTSERLETMRRLKRVSDAGGLAAADQDIGKEELRDIALLMLHALWESDDDPNRQQWPGGPDELEMLRALRSFEDPEGSA